MSQNFLEYVEELDKPYFETVVFGKKDFTAVLSISSYEDSHSIIRWDSRNPVSSMATYTSKKDAIDYFERSIKTTVMNGWIVGNTGDANWG